MNDPEDLGFTFRQRKAGEVEIRHSGKLATVLRGADAASFLADVEAVGSHDAQQLMARLTGKHKRGNERLASAHQRNRR